MTINQLEYFCSVCRYHSISRAAEELYVSQPAISLAIKNLEKEFNASFFSHGRNRITLTEEGEAFYQKAEEILSRVHELHNKFSDAESKKHPLRIGIPPLMSTVFFPRIYDMFYQEYNIPVRFFEYGSVRASNMVESGDLDTALVNMDYYNVTRFNSQVIMQDRYVYCVSRSHRFADRKSLTFQDLTDEQLIFFNTDSVQNISISSRFRTLNVTPNILMHSSQLYTILNFVRGGTCGAFLYSSVPVNPRDFVEIPIVPELTNQFGIVWKKDAYMSDALSKFISFIKNYDMSMYLPGQ